MTLRRITATVALFFLAAAITFVPGIATSTPAQAAAVAALSDDAHVEVQRARYAERRALVIDALATAGLRHEGGGVWHALLGEDVSMRIGRKYLAEVKRLAGK